MRVECGGREHMNSLIYLLGRVYLTNDGKGIVKTQTYHRIILYDFEVHTHYVYSQVKQLLLLYLFIYLRAESLI